MSSQNPITPKSKVLSVIEEYPKLEEVLINYVPAFKNLKNPVLRRTVAKIATLQQAASIANVDVETLINHLRREVGQDLLSGTEGNQYNTVKPEWFDSAKIAQELNAKEMLDRGEHPVNQVIADIKKLTAGSIYRLEAPFLPAPLIDKASSLSVEHWIEKTDDNTFNIYFFKP